MVSFRLVFSKILFSLFFGISASATPNPFLPQPKTKLRCEQILVNHGADLAEAVKESLSRYKASYSYPDEGWVLSEAEAKKIMARFKIKSSDELMLSLINIAQDLAIAPISGYRVGVIGREIETGSLIFAANLEFADLPPQETIHAEQFLFARAFQRGTRIQTLAMHDANPCGFCRQFMSEFAGSLEIYSIDPNGYKVRLGEFFPWAFDPAYLGQKGIEPSPEPLLLRQSTQFQTSEERLKLMALKAWKRSYAAFSNAKAGVALLLNDENVLSGSYVENSAFNPSLGPLHSALVNLVANGYGFKDIKQVLLLQSEGAKFNHEHSVRSIMQTLAPEATIESERVSP